MSKSRRPQTQGGFYDTSAQVCTPAPNSTPASEWDTIGNAERIRRMEMAQSLPAKPHPLAEAEERFGSFEIDGQRMVRLNDPSMMQRAKPPSPTGTCSQSQYNGYVEAGMLVHSLSDAFPSFSFTSPEEVQQKGRDYANEMCDVSRRRR